MIHTSFFTVSSEGPKPLEPRIDHHPDYRKRFWVLTLLLLSYRLLLSFVLELGNDEAYYWLYSEQLQWNYFDHPPLVALWIRIFTLNGLLDDIDGFVRLGGVAGCAIAAWFMYRAMSLIHGERSGFYAAVLYQASFYAGVTAGLYILPDSPQMVFWTLSMWAIAKIYRDAQRWQNWLLLGLAAGLTIMSKVHGVFIVSGFGIWVLLKNKAWLKLPQLWVALLLTLVVISPILIWNIHHDFVTYRYHSRRVELEGHGLNWRSFSMQLLSQVGFNNPVNFGLIIGALLAGLRGRLKGTPVLLCYALIGLPLSLVLLVVALYRDTTLPHWSGPAFVSMIPLAAVWLARTKKPFHTRALKWALGVYLISYTTWAVIVQYFPGTYSEDKQNLGVGDITVDMYGWRDASNQYAAFYREQVASGRIPAGAPMVTTHWWGGHVEYYFSRKTGQSMIGMNTAYLGHYLWTNERRLPGANLDIAICVVPSGDKYRVPKAYYQRIDLIKVIDVKRGGVPAHRYYVYKLQGLKKMAPSIGTMQEARLNGSKKQ